MQVKSQRSKGQSKVQGPRSKAEPCFTSHVSRFTFFLQPNFSFCTHWTLDPSTTLRAGFGLWPAFALLCSLLTPMSATAQMIGGGATISIYGVVQVEPGPDVVTLEVKGERIRFAIQNVYCSDRRFSTGGFMTDVTRNDPGLHLKGEEEWLEMLIQEPPSKRTLQMTGVYYRDSRRFMLNKLTRFSGKPGIQQ